MFTCFNNCMNISKIQPNMIFKSTQSTNQSKNPEFVDKLLGTIRNQDDINDCVAVPRGIFKAYLWIMGGFGLLGISGALPQKLGKTKSALTIAGNVMNIISAFYFAKGFAFKGVTPTVKMEELNRK